MSRQSVPSARKRVPPREPHFLRSVSRSSHCNLCPETGRRSGADLRDRAKARSRVRSAGALSRLPPRWLPPRDRCVPAVQFGRLALAHPWNPPSGGQRQWFVTSRSMGRAVRLTIQRYLPIPEVALISAYVELPRSAHRFDLMCLTANQAHRWVSTPPEEPAQANGILLAERRRPAHGLIVK